MLKISNVEVLGWEHAIRGMRNPMNSWEKSDTDWKWFDDEEPNNYIDWDDEDVGYYKIIGPNDLDLMKCLRNAGTDHRKFMRMITVYVDITAPLYWWKEFDTYKVGTVANSCSTMHKIHDKEFKKEDFSHEHLINIEDTGNENDAYFIGTTNISVDGDGLLYLTIQVLNFYRKKYLETHDKKYWWQMIQLLPTSYNQKRTVMMNYEVLANIYKSRKDHKLDEWAETKLVGEGHPDNMYPNKFSIGFCDWIKTLPYSELITGEFKED